MSEPEWIPEPPQSTGQRSAIEMGALVLLLFCSWG
jgi:hypothetical protein